MPEENIIIFQGFNYIFNLHEIKHINLNTILLAIFFPLRTPAGGVFRLSRISIYQYFHSLIKKNFIIIYKCRIYIINTILIAVSLPVISSIALISLKYFFKYIFGVVTENRTIVHLMKI